jgi:hypothetical protein
MFPLLKKGGCTVLGFEQNLALKDDTGSHACLQSVQQWVTEFMVRVLHSRMILDPTPARLKRASVRPIAFLSGVHFLTG